jgi:hypothetical protein
LAKGMVMMTIPFGSGGAQEMVCLPLDRVNFWLATDPGPIAAVRASANRDEKRHGS